MNFLSIVSDWLASLGQREQPEPRPASPVPVPRPPDFDKAHAFIAKWEGGWVNDDHDPGGETKYGISKRAYPDLDISSLTLEDSKRIYKRDYWRAAKCDQLPGPIALVHFDAAVNQGVGRAATFLQGALGVTQDGIIGAQTIAAARTANPGDVVTEYCARRGAHYGSLSTFNRFGRGWMRRLFDVHREALAPVTG